MDERIENLENLEIEGLLDPNADVLKEVQEAIGAQLKSQIHELKLEIKENEEATKRAITERETIGVELYNRQQQLAQLHETNEKCDENLNTIRQVRREVEQRRGEFEKTHERQERDLKKQKDLNQHYKVELDKLNMKLLQVERRKDEIESKVAIKRRKAYKTEEQMNELERAKRTQDLLIDNMNLEIRTLQRDIHFVSEQLEEQQKETKRAKEILAESKIEKEELEFRKKTLMQQWKSSLVGMQRRDQTLENLVQQVNAERERLQEKENEIEGYVSSVAKEKDELEKLANRLMKEENKEVHLEKQESEANTRMESIATQYGQMKTMLENVETKLLVDVNLKKKEETKKRSLQKKILQVSNAINEHEKQRLENMSDEVTFKKGTQSIKQEIEKVRSRVRDREIDIANYENEISRIKIDVLQTENHNKELHKIQKELEGELTTKVTMIDKYKLEVKKKHDEIEKKQAILDKANRELERLKANQQEENFGPLEAEIHNLQREIISKEKENELLNKNWIRQQSELVTLMNKSEQISMSLKELSAKRTILYQQHIRLASQTQDENSEIQSLKINVKKLHDSMKHLNSLISKHNDLQKVLSDENHDIRNRILARIKTREVQSRRIDEQIKGEVRNKTELTNELLETEKQIMFWEKKIELQIEIQKTLDPEIGQDEIKKMKKEIHIMEQRLEQLRRDIKKKIDNMKRMILKRGIIMVKGKAQTERKVNTKASVKREVLSLDQILKKKKAEKRRKIKEIRDLTKRIEMVAQENQEIDSLNKTIENDLLKSKEQIQISLLQRDLLQLHCQKDQNIIQDIQRNKFKAGKEKPILEKREKLLKIVEEMRAMVPNFEIRLSLVNEYLNSEN